MLKKHNQLDGESTWVAPPRDSLPVFHSTGYADNGIPVDYGSQDEWNLLWNSTEPIRRRCYKDDKSDMAKAGWMLQLDFRNGHIVTINNPAAPISIQQWCEQNLQKET